MFLNFAFQMKIGYQLQHLKLYLICSTFLLAAKQNSSLFSCFVDTINKHKKIIIIILLVIEYKFAYLLKPWEAFAF